MEQKIIQIGSSAGVTLSPKTLSELGVQVGDIVETNEANQVFSVRPKQKKGSGHIDPQIVAWTDDFIAKNRELLDRLKDK